MFGAAVVVVHFIFVPWSVIIRPLAFIFFSHKYSSSRFFCYPHRWLFINRLHDILWNYQTKDKKWWDEERAVPRHRINRRGYFFLRKFSVGCSYTWTWHLIMTSIILELGVPLQYCPPSVILRWINLYCPSTYFEHRSTRTSQFFIWSSSQGFVCGFTLSFLFGLTTKDVQIMISMCRKKKMRLLLFESVFYSLVFTFTILSFSLSLHRSRFF